MGVGVSRAERDGPGEELLGLGEHAEAQRHVAEEDDARGVVEAERLGVELLGLPEPPLLVVATQPGGDLEGVDARRRPATPLGARHR